ncbi:uncharacterized protein LOC117903224 [Drosophila subobscura]|uniref:uncharacterized protein LOC117891418 n=1 Tax=Drosophila subobscura TaxID=7241 RepID=UPI00155B3711|nr:uncharacterized protein LOC117891418 [Drosophila subobscura]XP_034671013.1 uncharacterized protein LOC117903222 [Drosophila subobscura]XP_034671014.1 uncharacterized protein LOC117903223 [Drosophila subobscura]XP_034671015.1 uncharacterized protein LOC117903224 [Drosophila subobscura]
MDLRSSAYRRLVAKPQDAGVYEGGMPYDGLKQLAQAVEMSAQEANEDEEKLHFERARYESELECLSSQPMDQRQSTMLPSPARASPEDMDVDMDVDISQPDCNSSVGGPIQLTVRATVHHALDWSPTAERRSAHKRRADSNGNTIGLEEKRARTENSKNQMQQQQPAAAEGDVNPPSIASMDSGVSGDELSSVTSSAYESSSVLSIGEVPSGLMVSTSSVAVSDRSRNSNTSSEIFSYESHE